MCDSQVIQFLIPLLPVWISQRTYSNLEDLIIPNNVASQHNVLITSMKDKSLLQYCILMMLNSYHENLIIHAYVTHPDLLLPNTDVVKFQVGNSSPPLSTKTSTYIFSNIADYLMQYNNQSELYDSTSSPVLEYACQHMGVRYVSDIAPHHDIGYTYPEKILSDPTLALLSFPLTLATMLRNTFKDNIYAIILVGCILVNEETWIDESRFPNISLAKKLYTKESPFLTRLYMADAYIRSNKQIVPKSFINDFEESQTYWKADMIYTTPTDILSMLHAAHLPVMIVTDQQISMLDTVPVLKSNTIIPLYTFNDFITNYIYQ